MRAWCAGACERTYGSTAPSSCVKCYHPVLNGLYWLMIFLFNSGLCFAVVQSTKNTTETHHHRDLNPNNQYKVATEDRKNPLRPLHTQIIKVYVTGLS